jgi:hypothetical protein
VLSSSSSKQFFRPPCVHPPVSDCFRFFCLFSSRSDRYSLPKKKPDRYWSHVKIGLIDPQSPAALTNSSLIVLVADRSFFFAYSSSVWFPVRRVRRQFPIDSDRYPVLHSKKKFSQIRIAIHFTCEADRFCQKTIRYEIGSVIYLASRLDQSSQSPATLPIPIGST